MQPERFRKLGKQGAKESKELIVLPDKLYKDFERPISAFMHDKGVEYRRMTKEFNELSVEERTGQQQAHTQQLSLLNEEVDTFVDTRVSDFFEYFGTDTDSIKDHLFFSLPLEVQAMVAHRMHPCTLFATVFLSTRLFSLLQGDKKMVIDTVTVTITTHGIYVVQLECGDGADRRRSSIQVVPRYDWRANGNRRRRFLQPVADRSWRLAAHIPTVTLPGRPTLPCLLKNVIPARKIRYLRLYPRETDLVNEREFFTQAFACADHFDKPTLVVVFARVLSRDGMNAILERRLKVRILLSHTFMVYDRGQRNFNTIFAYEHRPTDVLVRLEVVKEEMDHEDPEPVQSISIEPECTDGDVWRMYERWMNNDSTMKCAFVKFGNLDRYAALEHRIISSMLKNGYKRDFARHPNCCYVSKNVPGDTTQFLYSRRYQLFYMFTNPSPADQ